MHPPAELRVEALAVGSNHVCARKGDGTVVCWGRDNGYGQLGASPLGGGEPRPIAGLAGVADLAAGVQHTCVLLVSGAVRCWGENKDGQLGDGSLTNRDAPVSVRGLGPARAIYAGAMSTCAALVDGSTWCWGSSSGTGKEPRAWGPRYPEPNPRLVPGVRDVVTLAIGSDHVCAAGTDGIARCWGSGTLYELGDGRSDHNALVPQPVAGILGRPLDRQRVRL